MQFRAEVGRLTFDRNRNTLNKSEDGKQVGRFVDLTVGSLEIPYLTVSIFSSKYEARSSAKEQGGREATGDSKLPSGTQKKSLI